MNERASKRASRRDKDEKETQQKKNAFPHIFRRISTRAAFVYRRVVAAAVDDDVDFIVVGNGAGARFVEPL